MKSYAEIVFACYDRCFCSSERKGNGFQENMALARETAKQIAADEAELLKAQTQQRADALVESIRVLDELKSPNRNPGDA
jgi:uncharacterized protein YcfL